MIELYRPHTIINEDGREFTHYGYITTDCAVCSRPNTHSLWKKVPVCIGKHKETNATRS